jgi:GTPase
MEFEAEVLVLYHATTMSCKYQAMVHCGSVRQSARILSMDKDFIRTGDRSLVRFEFIQHPEYLRIGSLMVFREGN